MSQTLPAKEAALFKNIGRYHEKKQYKKALRCADDILAVHKTHGETLAMKGLTLNSLDKKEQAYECAKLGLKHNISSPICWHVFGLIHRSDRNYAEAKKCYLNAMRRDKNNVTLLRDLALLQIQLRDLTGFLKTRKTMLHLKPSRHESWFALSLAWQLLGRYDEAIDVMTAFEEIIEGSQRRKVAVSGGEIKPTFEDSERKLYIIRLFNEAGRFQDALNYLNDNNSQILDQQGAQELKAHLLLQLNNFEEAEAEYRALVDINTEQLQYHLGLQKALSKNQESSDQQTELYTKSYQELHEKYPSSMAISRFPLNFLSVGDAFRTQLDSYLIPSLRKGIPSLWATLEHLYTVPEKAEFIGNRALEYYNSLKETNQFPGHEDDELLEPPSAIFWTMFFLAQHFDNLKDHQKALQYIDEAIVHTPTAIDVYLYRAKILKHAGDIQRAADQMDECRSLDLADRYLNSITTKYLLKADRVEQADSTIELFTRDADNHNVSLSEMQCVWYEQNAADSFLRTKKYGKAVKKALSIDSHFQDFVEDQFDFHAYCLRKMTLRAYSDLLSFEDRLYSHVNYFNCARTLIKTYLALHDRPQEKELTPEERFAHLSGSELRKAIRKWKREQHKQEEQEKLRKEAEAKERQKQQQSQKKKGAGPVDEDPEGKLLEKVENPLVEAAKFASSLVKWCNNQLDTHLLAFEVYSRKAKWLLVLRSLKRATALAPDHPSVHYNKVFLANLKTTDIENEVVRSVFENQLREITQGASAKELNENYQKTANTPAKRLSFCRAAILLDPSSKDSVKQQLTSLEGNVDSDGCIAVHEYLTETYGTEAATEYRKECHKLFPLCANFQESTQESTENPESTS